jgi:hypothetical protein
VIARPAVRPALILGVTLVTAFASIIEAPSALRLILLLGFLTFLPGLSLVAFFPPRDMVSAVAFAVGVSLALDLLVVTASLYGGAWSPATLLVVLLAVTFIASGAQLARVSGLLPWPSMLETLGRPGRLLGPPIVMEPSFEGWYQVTSGPFKGMWTKSAVLPEVELAPYPGVSLGPGRSGAREAQPLLGEPTAAEPSTAAGLVSPAPGPEPSPGPSERRILPYPGLSSLMGLSDESAGDKQLARTRILSITSPVSRGSKATLIANTAPDATCHLVVYYRSGPTRVAGPGEKRADAQGHVSWTWTVGSRTAIGTWTIDLICDPGGSTSATLTVR